MGGMTNPPRLTDRDALIAHRRRAADAPVLFLQEAAADAVEERLEEVNRSFKDVAIVTAWPEVWADRFPQATVVSDDETLALKADAHDLVIHAMTLHWANDPVGQLVQCRRALREDGLFLATLFGGQTLQELRAALAQAEVGVTGGLSPRVAPMAEIRDVGGLLQRAGFALPVADSDAFSVSYRSPWHLMQELRGMGEGNALADRLRHFTRPSVLREAARLYRGSGSEADGRIAATFDIIHLAGWAPGADQPKALRPGSAKTRLADALGTTELDPHKSDR